MANTSSPGRPSVGRRPVAVPRWVADEASEFLQPFQTTGDVIFHVRAQPGKPGIVVTAPRWIKRRNTGNAAGRPARRRRTLRSQRREISMLLADRSLFSDALAALAAAGGSPWLPAPPVAEPRARADTQAVALAESRWTFVVPRRAECRG